VTADAQPTVRYETRDRKAYLTLDRPDRLNAIDFRMPGELAAAVRRANTDPGVHVIVLQGAGRAFCSGYDLKLSAEDGQGTQADAVWDPIRDYAMMKQFTDDYFTLWRSLKPTIAKVHGFAVAGGSDIALSCDLVVMAEDARIGYMPARVWGCPTTAMWVYRLGAERAKRMLLTGDTIDGRTAADWGLVLEAVRPSELDARVEALADRIAGVPVNQLVMQKLMINQAYPPLARRPLVPAVRRGPRLPRSRQVARFRPLDPRRRRPGAHPRRSGRPGGLTGTDTCSV
jgi:enoyl-CoA hydratase